MPAIKCFTETGVEYVSRCKPHRTTPMNWNEPQHPKSVPDFTAVLVSKWEQIIMYKQMYTNLIVKYI